MIVWRIRGKIIKLFCAVLCMFVVHNDMHTHEQFLKLTVGLSLGLVFVLLFRFSISCVFGRPFVKWFALCYQSVVCLSCPVCLSVCDVRALWPNGWTDRDETWHAGRPWPWPHCVRWGPSSPCPKGAQPHPLFGPYLLQPNGYMDQDATWYGGRPHPRGLCVRWETEPPPPRHRCSP